MSENKIDTEIKVSDNNEKAKKPKKNKSFLVYYSIALFLFAGILIGLSYLSQARLMADSVEDLSQKIEISTGVQTRLEQVSVKNDELEKSNKTLTEENTQLKTQVETLKGADKRAEATEYIWKIEKAFAFKKKKDCRKLIEELNNKGLRTALSTDALSELVRIETSIN